MNTELLALHVYITTHKLSPHTLSPHTLSPLTLSLYNSLHVPSRDVREVWREWLCQIVEQHVTIKLWASVVGELCLGNKMTVSHNLKCYRLRYVMFCVCVYLLWVWYLLHTHTHTHSLHISINSVPMISDTHRKQEGCPTQYLISVVTMFTTECHYFIS